MCSDEYYFSWNMLWVSAQEVQDNVSWYKHTQQLIKLIIKCLNLKILNSGGSVMIVLVDCATVNRAQGGPGTVGPIGVLLSGGIPRQVATLRVRPPGTRDHRRRSRDVLDARKLHLQEQALETRPVQDAVGLRRRMVGAHQLNPTDGRCTPT